MSETASIRAAVVGPTGYTGLWLIELLARHPSIELTYLASRRDEPTDITRVYPRLNGLLDPDVAACKPIDHAAIARAADVAFLALPHLAAMEHAGPLLDLGCRVVDLSADYRLRDPAQYQRVYQHTHTDAHHLAQAVYGLPELFRDKVSGCRFVANPGCYPTAAALALAPLLSRSLIEPRGIVINAASGVSGAGRNAKVELLFTEQNESYYAYGSLGQHRHQPEIEQTLATVAGRGVPVLFVPHLLPIDRGILETIYAQPVDEEVERDDLLQALTEAYADEPFVRIVDRPPNVKDVRDTNCCDLFATLVQRDDAPPRVLIFSAIDNMIKGASGQAVQNANLMFDLDETAGLI